jgi:hypothetical protein
MSSLDVTLNVENVKFCPGPCKWKNPEPEPVIRNNEKDHHFKPYNGGRYIYFIYPMLNGGNLTLKNVRMCPGCYHHYQDMMDSMDDVELYDEMLNMSDCAAKTIIAKLQNDV